MMKRWWIAILTIVIGVSAAFAQSEDTICPADELEITFNGAWSFGAPMPTERAEMGVALIDDVIYVAGGFAAYGSGMTDRLEAYNITDDSWETLTPMPVALHHAGMTAYDGIVYMMGGYTDFDFTPSDGAWRYDPETDEWSEIASLPQPHGAHGLVTIGDLIYLVGGTHDGHVLWAYDPATDTWNTELRRMPTRREHLGVTVFEDQLYVVGGRWSNNLRMVEAYNPQTDEWTELESMPTPRGGFTVAAVGDVIFAGGGEDFVNDFCVYNRVEALNVATQIWQRAPDYPRPLHAHMSVAYQDRWIMIGGATRAAGETYTSLVSDVLIFTPET